MKKIIIRPPALSVAKRAERRERDLKVNEYARCIEEHSSLKREFYRKGIVNLFN